MIPHNRYSKRWLYYLLFGAILLSACDLTATAGASGDPDISALQTFESQTANALISQVAFFVEQDDTPLGLGDLMGEPGNNDNFGSDLDGSPDKGENFGIGLR